MKYFALLTFIIFSSNAYCASREEKLSDARTIALSWLEKTSDDLHFYNLIQDNIYLKHHRKVLEVKKQLSRAKLKIINTRGCRKNKYMAKVPARFIWSKPKIHVCMQTILLDVDELAQVLIHESVHLTFVANECHTTQLEAFIVAWARFENVPVISKYYKDCGFVDNPNAILNFSWLR